MNKQIIDKIEGVAAQLLCARAASSRKVELAHTVQTCFSDAEAFVAEAERFREAAKDRTLGEPDEPAEEKAEEAKPEGDGK